MKKVFLFAAFAAFSLAVSCDSSTDEGADNGTGSDGSTTVTLTESEQAILDNYVDNVVMANYTQLATDGKVLLTAVEAIQSSEEEDKSDLISAAAAAWETARITWERTEAYLFGPVDVAGIDPGIDSWPLGLTDLQASIQGWDAESGSYKDLKGDGGDLKGFHAIEYMLFANGDAKSGSVANFDSGYAVSQGSLSDEQFEATLESYLVAVSEELYRCVLQLEAEWDLDGLSTLKAADLADFGSDITLNTTEGNYAEIFKNPSLDNAYYSSFKVAIEEAFLGAAGIADEVANAKISDPIDAEVESEGAGLLEVESWFSHNSVSDFTNNVRGIKEAYFGELCSDESTFDISTTPAESSIGEYVATLDADAADAIVEAVNDAIAKVKAMPTPFRDNLEWSSENTAAKEAVSALQEALEAAYDLL